MNALRKALADYFAVRRALGFKLYRAEKLLGQFLTFVEDRGEDHLTTEAALAWATLPKRGRTWAFARLSVVRRFAKHLRGIDPATEVPPTHLLVQQKGRATPYLYSESDIAALIAAAGTLRAPHRVATFRTLIALLAVTGMRVGEAIGLDRDDFDSVIGLLTIRNAKFGKSRQLPLHPSTVAALVDYLRRDDRPKNSSNTPALLVTTVGTRFRYMGVRPVFRQIVDVAGLKPRSASCRPRLHDLGHGFAVNTILDGYRDGREPGNRIALLSPYLGHVDPVSTESNSVSALKRAGISLVVMERSNSERRPCRPRSLLHADAANADGIGDAPAAAAGRRRNCSQARRIFIGGRRLRLFAVAAHAIGLSAYSRAQLLHREFRKMRGAGSSHCRDDRARSISRSFDQCVARHRLDAVPVMAEVVARLIHNGGLARQAKLKREKAALRDAIVRRVLKECLPVATAAPGFHTWLPLPAGRTLAALIAQAAQAGITLAPPGTLGRMESENLGVRLCLGAPATEADLERALIESRRTLEMAEAISFV